MTFTISVEAVPSSPRRVLETLHHRRIARHHRIGRHDAPSMQLKRVDDALSSPRRVLRTLCRFMSTHLRLSDAY
jgi:hypothetical protein